MVRVISRRNYLLLGLYVLLMCLFVLSNKYVCQLLRLIIPRLMTSIRFETTQGHERQTTVPCRSVMVAHLFHTRCPPCPLENGLGLESGVLAGALWQQQRLVHVCL